MITIFGSSTAYDTNPYGKSYVHLLKQSHGNQVQSFCMNGYTIWHANYILPNMLTERNFCNTVILHVGACECMTMALTNFLVMTTYWMLYGEIDHYFKTYFMPKMHKAAEDLHNGRITYYSYLTPDEFAILYERVLKHLEGYNVLVVGMSNPKDNTDIRGPQAQKFDMEIRKVSNAAPWSKYIDVWHKCDGEIVDSNHLTEEGHRRLYGAILEGLNK